jgi:TnpA family transposase
MLHLLFAYHHIADNYIALFSTFIPCEVGEAIEIIEALIKNKSDIKPTVHADTQSQSTVVFALAHLLSIDLMPRIRNWKNLKLFRPTKNSKYKHIGKLFSDSTINWKLIEITWKEMMRVVIFIKKGKITSSLLLRKLTHYSKKDLLYRGFQELGRVIRTRFLLK